MDKPTEQQFPALTIWKFPLPLADVQRIEMPSSAKILCAQTQMGAPFIWAVVNPQNETEERRIRIFGTGFTLENACGLAYIGTFQVNSTRYAYHVFEEVKP